MSTKAVVTIIVVLLAIIALIVWFKPFGLGGPEEPGQTPGPEEKPTQTITANHFYKDGGHTVQGNISLPTPCHELSNSVDVERGNPDQVTINFTVVSTAEICVQVIAERFFTVSFEADEDARIRATLNGAPIALELIAGGEGNLK